MAHAVACNQSALTHDFFSHREAGLLLEHNQSGKARIERVDALHIVGVRRVQQRAQHLGERETGVETIGARREIERRIQGTEAAQNRHRSCHCGQAGTQRANLRRCRHCLGFDARDRRHFFHDPQYQLDRHVNLGRGGVILQYDG